MVATALGPVQGRVAGGIHAFKGLRYAAAPTGANRFKAPGKLAAWTSPADAGRFGAPCVQMATGNSANPSTELSKQIATIFTTSTEMKIASEDCLFLNVWTPGDRRQAPGDGLAPRRRLRLRAREAGRSTTATTWRSSGDVVVVTVNHRLNVFGYLYLGELAGKDYEQSGNAGMLDLVAALEWVRDNIGAVRRRSGQRHHLRRVGRRRQGLDA